MSLITRKARCGRCGIKFTLTYPEGMSALGIETISYCKVCMRLEIEEGEAILRGRGIK